MDVDGPPFERCTQLRRQHLHVPGQHDQVDPFGLDDVQQLFLGRRLGRLCARRGRWLHRDVQKGNALRRHQILEIRVIGHHGRNIDVERADPMTEQQVVQAVAEPGHQNQHPIAPGGVHQMPAHAERLSDH